MDVYRFAKLPRKSNDPTRRYRVVRGLENDHVGEVEIVGADARADETLRVALICFPVLSDTARADALATTMRFVEELAAGWRLNLEDGIRDTDWQLQPDGSFLRQIEYRVV